MSTSEERFTFAHDLWKISDTAPGVENYCMEIYDALFNDKEAQLAKYSAELIIALAWKNISIATIAARWVVLFGELPECTH